MADVAKPTPYSGPEMPHVFKERAKNRDGQLVCIHCGAIQGLTATCEKPDQEAVAAERNKRLYRPPWTL